MEQKAARLQATCLCAAWCGVCREYRPAFEALQAALPDVDFRWADVEDEADGYSDVDVDNFPTLLIRQHGQVVFFGPLQPRVELLTRLLETWREAAPEAVATYVAANPERQGWQLLPNPDVMSGR